jgi:hypothetical protein
MRFHTSCSIDRTRTKLTSTLGALRGGGQGLRRRGAGDDATGGSRGADSRAGEGAREGGESGHCWEFR